MSVQGPGAPPTWPVPPMERASAVMSGPCPQRAPCPGAWQAAASRQKENWPPGCLGASLSSGGSGVPRCGVKRRCAECCQRPDYLRSKGRTPALNWCERQMAATAPRFCAIARQWQIWQCAPTANDYPAGDDLQICRLIAAFFAGAKRCEGGSPRASSLTRPAAAPPKKLGAWPKAQVRRQRPAAERGHGPP